MNISNFPIVLQGRREVRRATSTLGSPIGEPNFADAILDRIVHNAYRLDLVEPSMRKPQASERAESEPEPQPANKAVRSVTPPVSKPQKGDQK
jgi:hypothetical protein